MTRNQPSFPLPIDLTIEILLSLPLASILSCKRVSKEWNSLIKHPNFITRYNPNKSFVFVLDNNELYCVLMKQGNNKITIPINRSYTLHRIPIDVKRFRWYKSSENELLSGWSNGVACVKSIYVHFLLHNLLTGVSYAVEEPPLQSNSVTWMYYGFGYDRYDGDYKIMVAYDYHALKAKKEIFNIDKVQNAENSLFWVYSSRNRCWKSYDGFPTGFAYYWPYHSRGGAYSFNGVLHCAFVKIRCGMRVILTYDLHTHMFGEILAPRDDDLCYKAEVTELDGRLCYGYRVRDEWVIEVYGVGGSWTELARIPHPNSFFGLAYTALYEWGDGRKVGLLVCQGTLKWYDFSKNEIEEVDVCIAWLKKRTQQIMSKRDVNKCGNDKYVCISSLRL